MMVLFGISAVCILVYCIFVLGIANGLKLSPKKEEAVMRPEVSILIPCRNEESHIRVALESIFRQDYDKHKMEVIVIDDHSEDRTIEVANEFSRVLNLKVLSSNGTGKKEALKMGIEAALNPLILTTDADSFAGPHWLSSMTSELVRRDLDMLCGLVQLEGIHFFGEMQQVESAAVVGISAVMLNRQKPATCNGANLLFKKKVFVELGGYEGHDHIASGDDDLLMHRFANRDIGKVGYLMDPEGKVYSMVAESVPEFMQQRRRWISKRRAYIFNYNKNIQTLVVLQLIALYSMVYFLFTPFVFFAVGLIVFKLVSDLMYGWRLRRFIYFHYYMILLMPVYQVYLLPLLILGKLFKTKWKGRQIP